MKNVLRYVAVTALIPVTVWAQGSLDEEINADLDKMYAEKSAVAAPAAPVTAAPAVSAAPVAVPVAPVAAPATQVQVTVSQPAPVAQQKEATTVIEAAPLTESGAEKLRKSRQDAELATEQSIVEKLEKSRLEDEKRRAEVLFGDKFNSLANKAEAAPAAVSAAQPIQAVVVPAQPLQTVTVAPLVEEKKEEKLDREAIRGEVSAALAEMKAKDETPKDSTYIAAMVGAGDYPDAVNVRGQYSLGVAYGKKFEDRLVAEGSFLYSNYQVEQRDGGCVVDSYGQYQCYPRITDMNQYSTSALVKYQLLGGMLRPEIGTLLSYTYRTFTDTQFALSNDTVSSQALDMGVMTGASLELSKSFSMGLDFRYMWNLTNKVDSGFQKSYVKPYLNSEKPIERLNYYTLSISGRATF